MVQVERADIGHPPHSGDDYIGTHLLCSHALVRVMYGEAAVRCGFNLFDTGLCYNRHTFAFHRSAQALRNIAVDVR